MPERLKAILDKITAWWKKFNTKQRSVLISIVAVVIVALVILGVVISRPTQVELVEAQSASEASTIKGVLEDNNISYEVDSKLVFFVNKSGMLNDKHDELTRLSGDIDKASSRLRSSFEPLSADSAKRAEKPSVAVQKPAEPKSGTMQQDTKPDMKQMTGIDISGIIKTQPASAAPASKAGATTATGTAAAVSVKASDAAFGTPAGSSANADVINHTHEILKLYKSGKSNVEIAKLLSLGTGEVKLIIDLYKEGK